MPGTVNTEFVLDMQRKLFRWSDTDAERCSWTSPI